MVPLQFIVSSLTTVQLITKLSILTSIAVWCCRVLNASSEYIWSVSFELASPAFEINLLIDYFYKNVATKLNFFFMILI